MNRILLLFFAVSALNVNAAAPSAHWRFARDVAPLIGKYCFSCHSSTKPRGGVALDRDRDDLSIRKHAPLWEKVGDNLRSGEMPPARSPKPTAAEMEVINRWLDEVVYKSDCTGPQNPGRVTIRRLNRAEYNNTIRDLVGVEFKPAKDFPADDVGYGFDNIGDVLSLPPLLMEKYIAAAEKIIGEAWKQKELRKRLLPIVAFDRSATAQNLRHFASRAWRRPVTQEETDRLVRLVQLARTQGDSPDVGIQLALQAVLVSPHFLFRIEQEPEPARNGLISPYELASRLSYFLWSNMPDEELLNLARDNKLHQPKILAEQVRRMLNDGKSSAMAEHFAGQWLNTRGLQSLSFDPKRFPGVTASLKQAMQQETELFFLHIARENRRILDFIDADYTFVNERLASYYGLSNIRGEQFRRVSLTGTPRGGVLTQASVLAVTSNPTRTSPVKRGKWILENILGTPPPPPAPDAGELKEDGELRGTLRQQMEQHRRNPSCATCHQRMDPLGFSLENFDAVGKWRTHDGKNKIDASGELPDGSVFRGPDELRKVLLGKKEQFCRCLAEKLLTYALGRGTERSDRCYIEEIVKKTIRDDYRFVSLVTHIVTSEPFLKRAPAARGKK